MAPSCKTCHAPLAYTGASLSILLINGDEEILSPCLCPLCGRLYIEGYEDRFMSEDVSLWLYGPYTGHLAGEIRVMVERCPHPGDKHCRCEAHRYFLRLVAGVEG